MNPTELNLNKILPATIPDFSDLLARTIDENSLLASLKASLIKAAAGQQWSGQVAWNAQDNLDELLDVDLQEVLIGAWNKSTILRKYLDVQRYPPDKTFMIHLSEHSIRSEHRPYLEVSINGLSGKLEFRLVLELKVKGFKLKIRGGEIHEILSGECRIKATFSCGPALLWMTETGTISLPGSIKLEPPQKIGG